MEIASALSHGVGKTFAPLRGAGHDSDTQTVLTIGAFRFRRLPRLPQLAGEVPELFELSGLDGTVYAVTGDKDWLIAVMHRLQPGSVDKPVWATMPNQVKPYTLVRAYTLDARKRMLFEYYEVWDNDGLWARFPTEPMARHALAKLGVLPKD